MLIYSVPKVWICFFSWSTMFISMTFCRDNQNWPRFLSPAFKIWAKKLDLQYFSWTWSIPRKYAHVRFFREIIHSKYRFLYILKFLRLSRPFTTHSRNSCYLSLLVILNLKKCKNPMYLRQLKRMESLPRVTLGKIFSRLSNDDLIQSSQVWKIYQKLINKRFLQ